MAERRVLWEFLRRRAGRIGAGIGGAQITPSYICPFAAAVLCYTVCESEQNGGPGANHTHIERMRVR